MDAHPDSVGGSIDPVITAGTPAVIVIYPADDPMDTSRKSPIINRDFVVGMVNARKSGKLAVFLGDKALVVTVTEVLPGTGKTKARIRCQSDRTDFGDPLPPPWEAEQRKARDAATLVKVGERRLGDN